MGSVFEQNTFYICMEFSKSNNGEVACLTEIEKNLQTIRKHKTVSSKNDPKQKCQRSHNIDFKSHCRAVVSKNSKILA